VSASNSASAIARCVLHPHSLARTVMASMFDDLINDARTDNKLDDKGNDTVARNALFISWKLRLSHLDGIDAESAHALNNALLGNGVAWTTMQMCEMSRLIFSNCGKRAAPSRRMQKATNIENLLSEKDWAKLRTNKFEHANVALVSRKVASLNIKNASEPTLFRLVDILQYCSNHEEPFSQTKRTSLKETLQSTIKSEYTRMADELESLPWLTEYPFAASDLPQEIIKLAYGDEPLPSTVDIPELEVKGEAKMRPNRQNMPAWLKKVPSEHRHLFIKPINKRDRSTSVEEPQVHAKVDNDPPPNPRVQSQIQHGVHLSIDPSLFTSRATKPSWSKRQASPKRPMVPIKIEITDSPAKPQPPTKDTGAEHTDGAASGTIEEMEKELVAAVARREAQNKATKKVWKSDTYGKVMKRVLKKPSAAAACPVKKKPAAAAAVFKGKGVDMKDVFKTLRDTKDARSRGAFTTYAYKKAEQRMLTDGAPGEKAKEFARLQHKKASDLWNELS
jgi:hypothetical protein